MRPPIPLRVVRAGSSARSLAWGLVIASVLAIGLATLQPAPVAQGQVVGALQWCVRCSTFGAVDLILNALLFMPLGVGLRSVGFGARRAMGAMITASILIEFLQLTLVRGRDPNVADVLANSAGGALGLVVAMRWCDLVLPTATRARQLAAAGMLALIGARAATVWLLQPSLLDSTWYGQVAAKGVYPADFGGTVLHAELGDMTLSSGRVSGLRERLLSAPWQARAVASPGPSTSALAPLMGVLDHEQREMVLLAREGDDARFRVRLRAADLHLRVPSIKLRDAFPHDGGQSADEAPLTVTATFDRGRLSLATSAGARESVPLGAGSAWALFAPTDVAFTRESSRADALWTFAMLLPVCYWVGRAFRTVAPALLWSSCAAALVLTVPNLAMTGRLAPVGEWLAVSVAAAVGTCLGVGAARRWPAPTRARPPATTGRAAGSST